MNSFRAFKLKLPKRVNDENQTDCTDEEKVHPSNQVDDYAVQGPSRRAVSSPPVPADSFLLEASKHKQDELSIKSEIHDFNFRAISPISSYLPLIGSRENTLDHPQQGKETSVLRQPEHASSRLRFPMQFPQLALIPPDSYPDDVAVKPIGPGELSKDPPKQSEVTLPNSTNLQSPKPDVSKTQRSVRYSSSPSSDSESSSKCSSSPTSIDSGYRPSSDQNATASERKVDEHSEVDKREGCFKCSYCRRSFSYLCHLKVHARVHTGEKPYCCKFCFQQFSQLGSLTVHMRIHTGAKPYKCGHCSKKFRHVNSLRRHQRQVHNLTNSQIAASIDKYKEKPNTSTGMRLAAKHTSRQRLIERRMEGFTYQILNASEIYRQQILHSYNEHRLRLPKDEQPEMHTFLKNGAVHDPRSPSHHKSKFICEIEGRLERDAISTNGTKAPCGLGIQTATSNLNSAKPAPKTWRPFSTDEDEVSSHQVTPDDKGCISLHTNKSDQSQSIKALSLTSIDTVKVENHEIDGNNCLYSYHKPEYGHTYWGDLPTQQQSIKPSWIWPSPLSLRASFKPQPLLGLCKESDKAEISKNNIICDSQASSKAQTNFDACKESDVASKSNTNCDSRDSLKAQTAFNSRKENDKTEPTKSNADCALRRSCKAQPAFTSRNENHATETSKSDKNSSARGNIKAQPVSDSLKESSKTEITTSNLNCGSKGESEGHPENTEKHSAIEIEKGEKEENSSDEGFCSICSTEDVRSPHSSLNGSQGSEEPLNIPADDASLQVQKNPG